MHIVVVNAFYSLFENVEAKVALKIGVLVPLSKLDVETMELGGNQIGHNFRNSGVKDDAWNYLSLFVVDAEVGILLVKLYLVVQPASSISLVHWYSEYV